MMHIDDTNGKTKYILTHHIVRYWEDREEINHNHDYLVIQARKLEKEPEEYTNIKLYEYMCKEIEIKFEGET